MTLPPEAPFGNQVPIISPDGRQVASRALDSSGLKLWVRSFDSLEWRPLQGTEGNSWLFPFWSPDSRFIAFFSEGKLNKVASTGGLVQTIYDAENGYGGTWNRDGVILIANKWVIYQVPAAGGEPTPVTTLDKTHGEELHRWPQFLPDGRQFVYLSGRTEGGFLYVGSLDSDRVRRLFPSDSRAVYTPPGYLLFVRDGNLLAQPFDADDARLTGEAIPIASSVPRAFAQRGAFSVSDSGVLLYSSESDQTPGLLTWFDRSGQRLGTVGEPGRYFDIELSPDGMRVAIERFDPETENYDIWQFDLSREVTSRLTSEPSWDSTPRWSPSGDRVAFTSNRSPSGIYQVPSSGIGQPEPLFNRENVVLFTSDWSHDGRYIAWRVLHASDLLLFPLSGKREPVPLLDAKFIEGTDGRFSPDGQFLAYVSNESGRYEVYVTTFPESDQRWPISREGGRQPLWRPDGEELYYISTEEKLIAVTMKTEAGFEPGFPEELFLRNSVSVAINRRSYAVAAAGERFLVTTPVEGVTRPPFTVVLNWLEDLKRLAPTN